MIKVTICKHADDYVEFESKGHAEFDEQGYDIVCAAVSVLVINTINSIEQFTEDDFEVEEGDDLIRYAFENTLSEKAKVLMDALVLGLQTVQENYGNEYMKLIFKEV